MPPSCGWQRTEVMSGPAQYLNYVTGQTLYKTPNVRKRASEEGEGQHACAL